MNKKNFWAASLALLLTLLLAACQPATETTESTEGEGGTAASGGTTGGGAKSRPAPEPVSITIPADTAISVRLGSTIDTGSSENGAAFEGTLSEAISVGGTVVAPVGNSVAGKITKVVSSGRLKTPAEIHLVLTSLTLKGGKTVDITTDTWSMKGKSHAKRNVGMIGGGAGAGAIIGGIVGGKKGAAIGAGVGAGSGTAVAAYTGKDEIVLAPETALAFKLASPVQATL